MSSYKNIFISAKDGDSILFPELYTAQDVKNEMLLNISKLPLTGKTANIFDDDINLIRDVTFIEGKYLKYDDGEELVLSGYSYTDYIDVSGISKLQISSVPENGGCFYDENKNFLSGFARKGNTTEYNAIVEVPEKAKYIRLNFSMQSRSSRTAYMIDYTKSPSAVEYPWLKMLVTTILNPVATASGYMTENGTINTSVPAGGTITKYDVSGINSVFISISTNISLGANPKWCTIWVVDSDNTPILMLPVDTTGNTFSNYNLVIPKLGTQLWVQSKKPEVAIKSNINEVLTNIQQTLQTIQSSMGNVTNQWIGKKIVWLGTSIPYGPGTDGVGNALNTYPMQVGAKLGAHVVNVAQNGNQRLYQHKIRHRNFALIPKPHRQRIKHNLHQRPKKVLPYKYFAEFQRFRPIGRGRRLHRTKIMFALKTVIGKIFDRSGIGDTVHQHSVGFRHFLRPFFRIGHHTPA